MGGLIAYEIAQQLLEEGESIGLLAMMDTRCPDNRGATGMNFLAPIRMFLSPLGMIRRTLDGLRVRRTRAANQPLPHALRHREIERAHYRALSDYRPRPYDGRALLFKVAERRRSTHRTKALGWEGIVRGGIEVIELPGNHDNLIEQPGLLRELRRELQVAKRLT